MEQKHRKAIQTNFKSLVARTDLDSMVTTLYEKGVFSEQMIEPYRDKNESSGDRKRKLYMDIMSRGPRAFTHLIDALSEQGYWDLVSDLDPSNPFSTLPRPPNSSNPVSSREAHPQPTEDFLSLREASMKNRTRTELQRNSAPVQPLPDNAYGAMSSELDNASGDTPDIKLEVMKSTKFIEDNDNDLKLYHTRGRNRGVMLLFSYVLFKNNIENDRQGADVDCATLKSVFSEMGLKVISYPNLEHKETIDTLRSLDNVLVDVECVFTVVSSHGYERHGTTDIDIRCSDGKLITFYEIMSFFDNKSLPRLVGIPKIFVFQVCRGSNLEYMWYDGAAQQLLQLPMPSGELAPDVRVDGQPRAAHAPAPRTPRATPAKIPLYSDILIAHSTLPGFASFRRKQGSWYIQVMCQVFAERAHNTHVDKLFTLVDQRLRDTFHVQTSSIDRWGFNKRLYLHPGLFE